MHVFGFICYTRNLPLTVIHVSLENPGWSEDILLTFLSCRRANTHFASLIHTYDMGWVRSKPPVEIQLPENDARILAKYEHRAKQFDEMIKICCCWIGYDVLLGNK